MRKILILGVLAVSLFGQDLHKKYIKEWKNLKPYQKDIAKMIYNHAKKDDLAWTATAIAWQESQFGRWQINVNSRNSWDCGIFQNNTKSVAKHNDIPHNRYNKKEICTDLITNFRYAYLNFAKEITFWERVHKGRWSSVWSSYNGGWKGSSKYSNQIANRIKVLKKFIKD